MCFSATASFVTAGTTGIIGIVALTRVTTPRELPLAAACLFFALQQSIEGLLWLNLPLAPDGAAATGLFLAFLFFAEVFWPIYAPIAALLIEPSAARRRLMRLCLGLGVAVGAWCLWAIVTRPHGAAVLQGHIVYVTEHRFPAAVGLAYLAATSLSLILSSRRTVAVLGAIVLVGCVATYAFYWEAFVSVWCFFAAAASVVILGHFELRRRRHLGAAGA